MIRAMTQRGGAALALLAMLTSGVVAATPMAYAKPGSTSERFESSIRFSGSATCPSPPAGWDPATASAQELRFYGLPLLRASSGPIYRQWLDAMRHAKQRICGGEVQGPTHPDGYRSDNVSGGTNGDFWSGYAVTSGGYNWTSAGWNVSCYSGTSSSQRTIEWVGIGGYNSNDLWQAGTETDHAEGYRLWYEAASSLTSNLIYAGPAVACGNSIWVEVDYNYSVSRKAYLDMENYSNGQYWATTKSFQPSNNSAEWIVERPSCPTGNYAYAPFTNVNWTDAVAASTSYYNDVPFSITSFAYSKLNPYQDGVELSSNSAPSSGGNAFTTTYLHSGNSFC